MSISSTLFLRDSSLEFSEEEILDLTRSSIPPDEVLVLDEGEEEEEEEEAQCSYKFPLPLSPSRGDGEEMRRPNLRLLNQPSSSYDSPPPKPSFALRSVGFGIFGSQASFSPQWEREAAGGDEAYFEDQRRDGKRALVIRIWDQGKKGLTSSIRITIELQRVTRIQLSSGGKSFFFSLHLPPLFEVLPKPFDSGKDGPPRQVDSFDDHHSLVALYSSKTLRINLRSQQEVRPFMEQIQARDLPRVVSSKITTDAELRIGQDLLEKMSRWMREIEIPIAFQVEKLVRNGLVDPVKMYKLRGKIEDIVSVQRRTKAERILVLFAESLVKLDELSEETAEEIVIGDDDRDINIKPQGKKRKRQDSPIVLPDSDDSDQDDDVILPPLFRPSTRTSTALSSHELSTTELRTLLDHAVTRSVSFAQLYSSASSTTLARQLTITPSGFALTGPLLEDSNSILRRYAKPENFIRVAVREEDGSLLGRGSEKIVDGRFKRLFREGFELGGRKWHFLAWAASSLKSGQAFFLCPFEDDDGVMVTPQRIHQDIGDFTGTETARNPAKYFARISQAFTSSKPSITLKPDQIIRIDDLVSPEGSLFSDGVGLISPSLAKEVVAALGMVSTSTRKLPNCFQVRLGGAKGMLQVDPSLEGKQIALRPSQIKFKSSLVTLEIADTFSAKTGYLNRPLIKVLEDLGVKTDSFLRLQKSATKSIRQARSKLESTVRLLDEWSLSPSSRLSQTLAFLARHSKTSKAAFSNPFVSHSLDAAVVHILRDIKYKARIPLPGCYNLVGVVDINDILEEDEIFARIQTDDGTIQHLEGRIAISRSPTNHPGDVRIVKAVGQLPKGKADRIRKLLNCVVFSAKGTRSLPSMLAGGDLDGDLYLLLTESSGLLPIRMSAPANYDPSPVKLLDREANLQDGANFFFDYIANDLTAHVASRQLRLADFYSEGLHHPDCLKLAQLHSDCVDFVKSGTPIDRNDIPRIPLKMLERGDPDFFNTSHQYNSPKALGQLYRNIKFDSVKPPNLDPTALDPLRSLTSALLSLKFVGLFNSRLPPSPSRPLVERFKSYLPPFSAELAKIAELSSPPAFEEELFMNVFVKAQIERSDKFTFSSRRERVDQLFNLVRKEIGGKDEDSLITRIETAWAAWMMAVEYDEEHATLRQGRKFGLRSWGFLALGVLGGLLDQLEREQVEEIVIEEDVVILEELVID